MKRTARSTPTRLRDAVIDRRPAVILAVVLVLVGLYPGPSLVLLGDAVWRTHAIVSQLPHQRAFWSAGLLVLIGPAIVLANMMPARFDRAWPVVRDHLAVIRTGWFMTGAAAFAVIAAAAVAIYVLTRQPTTSDEVAQLWHARILTTGRLSLPPDPNPEFFAVDNIVDRGRWYSQFPIGGPAALSLAMLVGAAWLLNPLLAGLTVVNVYRFASRVYGGGSARLSAVLCATCPFLLMMSGSYMNHTPVVFLATLALAELPAWTDGSDRRRRVASIVIGLALGAAITVRPLDGAVATLVLGGVVLHEAVRHARVKALLLAIAAGAGPILLLLVANWRTTGGPLLFGYEVLWGANHSLGFHDDPSGIPHTPARGLALAVGYVMQLNWALFEWPIAGLLVVGGALLVIGKFGRWETVLLLWVQAQLLAYAAYWHAGLFFGPRYLFTVVPAFLILVARGIVLAEERASPAIRRSLVAGVAASILGSWLIPSAPVGALGAAIASRPLRWAFKVDLDSIVESLGGAKAVIFVPETATTRLARRLWGLGIARPDAARLVATRDNCALLEAAVAEARRPGSPAERLARLERTKTYTATSGGVKGPDGTFRVSDRESLTPFCYSDGMLDAGRRPVAYGAALLLNEIGRDGRIDGRTVFVADIAEHNEVLRDRFADRPWYRLEPPAGPGDRVPRLVPYK